MKSAMLVVLVLFMVLSHPSVVFGADDPFQDSLAQATRLAEKGDPEGQYQLGQHFDYGWGVKRDPSQAAIWYEKAATKGHIEAQHALGLLNTGAGSCPLATPEESAKWFRAAAEQGHPSSQHFIGRAMKKAKALLEVMKRLPSGMRGPPCKGMAWRCMLWRHFTHAESEGKRISSLHMHGTMWQPLKVGAWQFLIETNLRSS